MTTTITNAEFLIAYGERESCASQESLASVSPRVDYIIVNLFHVDQLRVTCVLHISRRGMR